MYFDIFAIKDREDFNRQIIRIARIARDKDQATTELIKLMNDFVPGIIPEKIPEKPFYHYFQEAVPEPKFFRDVLNELCDKHNITKKALAEHLNLVYESHNGERANTNTMIRRRLVLDNFPRGELYELTDILELTPEEKEELYSAYNEYEIERYK